MKYILKSGTEKKLREQLYLGLFFSVIIWILMAFLFVGDSRQSIVIYILGSLIVVPYIFKKQVKPYLDNLTENTRNAFIMLDDKAVTFNHFSNMREFNQQKIEFQIADIINFKKGFRKDDSVNKITLTVNNKHKNINKVKIIVEDFENMEELAESLIEKINDHQHQSLD